MFACVSSAESSSAAHGLYTAKIADFGLHATMEAIESHSPTRRSQATKCDESSARPLILLSVSLHAGDDECVPCGCLVMELAIHHRVCPDFSQVGQFGHESAFCNLLFEHSETKVSGTCNLLST